MWFREEGFIWHPIHHFDFEFAKQDRIQPLRMELNGSAFHATPARFIPEALTHSSSARIRTLLKPARVRYVSISCGVEFCVI